MKKRQLTIGLLSLAALTVGSSSLMAQRQRYSEPSYVPMSGTYELETTRGENAARAAQTATRSVPPRQRDRAYQSLLSRLEPPQTLSIDRNGHTITIASSRGPRSAFDADGQTRSERGPSGMVTTRSEIVGNRLTVSTNSGSRGSDFSVTFEALNNGATLLVTRRLDDDDLPRAVTIQSYYRRVAAIPRWDVYISEPRYGRDGDTRAGFESGGGFMVVPEGTQLLATLDTRLSMRTSRNGEPFTMTVRSPAEFQGARIDGVVSRVNAYRGNSQDLRVEFETIQLRGRSSEFAAFLTSVRLPDGALLRVDPEGDVRGVNRGDETVQNGAIGAAMGAIIGAIAGGGKGAAVGAVVGGAGGIILSQGHEQLDLAPGAEVTLTVVSRYRVP